MQRLLAGLLFGVAVGCGGQPPAATDPEPASDPVTPDHATARQPVQERIAGCWQSDWGPLSFEHKTVEGNEPVPVTGFWIQGPGMLGEITGGTFDPRAGKVDLQTAEPWIKQTGTVELTLSADGNTLEGTGKNLPSGQTFGWKLTRRKPGPKSISGKWITNWGPMTFEHKPIDANKQVPVNGSWVQGPGKLGVIKKGTYDAATGKLDLLTEETWIKQTGTVQLTLSTDGNALEGSGNNLPSGETYVWKMIRQAEE